MDGPEMPRRCPPNVRVQLLARCWAAKPPVQRANLLQPVVGRGARGRPAWSDELAAQAEARANQQAQTGQARPALDPLNADLVGELGERCNVVRVARQDRTAWFGDRDDERVHG